MKNKSGLTPVGQAVLVEPYEPERNVKSSIIAIPPSARERMTMAEQRATVVAIGPEAWKDEKGPRAKVGDRVMISAYAGMMTTGPRDGKQYRVINARDIFLCISAEF
jgi:co-chaperonin GroES (HSP10)